LLMALLCATPALARGRQCCAPAGCCYGCEAYYGYGYAAYYGGYAGYALRPGVPGQFCPQSAPPIYYVPPTYGNWQGYYTQGAPQR
jgi:hypothetical protein